MPTDPEYREPSNPRSRSVSVASHSALFTETLTSAIPEGQGDDAYNETTGLLSGQESKRAWMEEIKGTWTLAWPVIGTFMLQMGPGMINVLFLGHLPDQEALGAGTLSTMFLNITGNTVAMGLASAMDTLGAQAYGSGQKKKLGVILQRSLLILGLFAVPIAFSWVFAEQLLLAIKQEAKLAHMAGQFCQVSLVGMPAIFIYMCLQKYLQCQGVVKPSLYVAIFSNIFSIGLNWFFMYALGFGFLGAPLARAGCQWLNVLLLLAYMKWTGAGSETWDGWSRDCLKEWGPFVKLALPGLIMLCAEFWAFEIQTLGAGYFGTEYLNAQSVILQIISISDMIPTGLGVAASIRIGQYLGQGKAQHARRSAGVAMGISLIATLITATLTFFLRWQIPLIYTTWDKAVEATAAVLPIIAAFLVFDGVQVCGGGVLRGCGRQKVGALLAVIVNYVLGIPIGFYLGFKMDHKTKGLWEGMFIGLSTVCVVMVWLIIRTDWEKEVENCHERIGKKLPSKSGEEEPLVH